MMPVEFGVFVFPGFAEGLAAMCRWCDQHTIPYTESLFMWSELERGSWPARIQGLIDGHTPHPNCRCALPQVDPPGQSDPGQS